MPKITRSNKSNKKFKVKYKGKTIDFGAKGHIIKKGTKAGNSYCARSLGIKNKQGRRTANDKNSPNYWSRKQWGCKGKKSHK